MNKNVSNMIQRLQSHNFKWENKSFDELIKEYPNCRCALKWWTNTNPSPTHNIKNNKYLKEFIIENPPKFKISDKCCKYAKKDLVHNEMKKGYELDISGVRRAEGGVRATAYKSCFDNGDKYDNFKDELEYLFIEHFLLYGAFRFLRTDRYKELMYSGKRL